MLGLLLALVLPCTAREVSGVELPESVSVAGAPLQLNGAGIRERYFLDIYLAALYLPAPTHDAATAIESDVPKRLVMHFIYKKVTEAQAVDALRWRLETTPAAATIKHEVDAFVALLEDFARGDEVVFDYVPGKGTTVTVKGLVRATFPGAQFMKAVWSIFLGDTPITQDLKDGLLGL